MARLNEPPAPMENLDALKRRFIRQNREIARVNSTQSLRIRTLEGEISHLLSENIALREHVIRLQYEVERSPGRMVLDDVGNIRGKLEAKLSEIGNLVQELGKFQTDVENRRSPKRRATINNSSKRSPDQRNWKNVLSLAEVTAGVDGRLPPIVEDKYYPRKTLDSEELLGILPDAANAIDSPELGPPPIAHFEGGDPTKFDPGEVDVQPGKTPFAEDDIPPAMFANLETRKRRRETTNLRKSASHEIAFDRTFYEPAGMNDLRSSPSKGENPEKRNGFPEHSMDSTYSNVRDTSAALGKNRKALGPKSVNTDPTSPSKVKKLATNNKACGDPIDRAPRKIFESKRLKDKPRNAVLAIPEDVDASHAGRKTPEPEKASLETPAIAFKDVDASDPSSVIRLEVKDTSLLSDLNPVLSNSGALDTTDRATRRPRGSVSYAEPNLRAKMRRPTKNLADAVKADDQTKLVIEIPDGEPSGDTDLPVRKTGMRTVFIKRENSPDLSNLWHIPPESQIEVKRQSSDPLENQTHAEPVDDLIDRAREGPSPVESHPPPENKPSRAGSAIAALSAGRPKSRKRDTDEGTKDSASGRPDTLNPGIDSLTAGERAGAVGAGDNQREPERTSSGTSTSTGTTTRTHRRHSSIPRNEDGASEGRRAVSGTIAIARRRDRTRESLLGAASTKDGDADVELKTARSVARLQVGAGAGAGAGAGGRGTESGAGAGAGVGGRGTIEGGRAERAASRRRSMML